MQKKYEVIVSWMKEELKKGRLQYGDKLPAEKVLMEQFSVSRQTVRKALSILQDEGLVKGKRGSGTYVDLNTRKRTGSEVRIAVMMTYVDIYIFPTIVKEIEAVLSGNGCTLQISVTNNAIEKERLLLKEFIRNQSIDGLIAETTKSGLPNPNLGLYQELEALGIPVLFINSFYKELDIPHVSLDDKGAGYLAAKHLLDCGHRRIGGIFKADDGQGHMRYAGYTEALMQADVKVRGRQILWMDSDEIAEMDKDSQRILDRMADCTACVCYNDEIANKLIKIMKESGREVPRDISIVGIDNSSLAELCPVPITSIANPVQELGRAAAQEIVQKIQNEVPMKTIELQPNLVMRHSVRVIHEIS